MARPPQQSPGFANAPVFIILCGDPKTNDAFPLTATLQSGEQNFISGLASAFLYMHLAASTLGLGSQWVTSLANPYVQSLTKDFLGILGELRIYDMMAVGYPAFRPGPRLVRAKEEMVHYDYYDKAKFRTPEEVKEFIATLRRS